MCIGIRIAHSYINVIIIMFEAELERKCIKFIRLLLFKKFGFILLFAEDFAVGLIILIICDIVPSSIPTKF